MSDLYGRYKVSYEKSILMLSKIELDDAYLDSACFDAQQALEFLMKHILNNLGISFSKSHDIAYLHALLKDAGFSFEEDNTLESLESTITSWEEGSRYKDGVRTTRNTVKRVYKVIDSINKSFIEKYCNSKNSCSSLCDVADSIAR